MMVDEPGEKNTELFGHLPLIEQMMALKPLVNDDFWAHTARVDMYKRKRSPRRTGITKALRDRLQHQARLGAVYVFWSADLGQKRRGCARRFCQTFTLTSWMVVDLRARQNVFQPDSRTMPVEHKHVKMLDEARRLCWLLLHLSPLI